MASTAERRYYSCIVCNSRPKPKERRPVNKSIRRYLSKKLLIEASGTAVICNKCRHKYYLAETHGKAMSTVTRADPPEVTSAPSTSSTPLSPPSVTLKLPCTPRSHARCFICKKPGPRLVVIQTDIRFEVFLHHGILIPAGSRCCPGHVVSGHISNECIQNIQTFESSSVNRSTILDLIDSLRKACLRNKNRLDFEFLQDRKYRDLTGLSKENFDGLCASLENFLQISSVRSPKTTVGIFLVKMKTGMSNKLLSTIFGITPSSVHRAFVDVRKVMTQHFVPQNLGLAHITKQDIVEKHTRPLAQQLFGTDGSGDNSPKLVLVVDGTYIYIQKSANFQFQRRSYSVHKGRPLVKPMVVVTTTGYFVTVVGPFLADSKNNDAQILNHMLKSNVEDIRNYLGDDSVLIIDRGFRDSLALLEELGIDAKMPSFMHKGQSQMTTEEANTSRLVSKVRWVVESANARIKRWKYLDQILPTTQVPYIGDLTRIVCSVCNKYFPALSKASSEDDDKVLANKMLVLSAENNNLKSFVEEAKLERKTACWVQASSTLTFPKLDLDTLRDITCGVYQLKMSSSYMQEHLEGNSDIFVHREDECLIRVKIQSRHISSKQYTLWIRHDENNVLSWYCKCRAGSRVVGVCAHVASILWYLGYARYFDTLKYGVRNWGEHILDADQIPQEIDVSDTDSE